MTQYTVIALVDASVGATIEAESPEEAYEKGVDEIEIPVLCHHCSREMDTGDVIKYIIENDETGEVVEYE